MDLKIQALQRLRPNAQWVLRGDQLEWLDTEQTEPTQAEIEAEIAYLQSEEYEVEQWRQTARVRTWQLKAILDEDNLLETVEGIVAQSPKAVQLAWEHAPDVMRTSKAVNQILQALELTPEQGDDIFKRANLLEI